MKRIDLFHFEPRQTEQHLVTEFELTQSNFEVLLQVGEDCLAQWVHTVNSLPCLLNLPNDHHSKCSLDIQTATKPKNSTLLLRGRAKIFRRNLWWFLRSIPPPVSTSTAMKFAVGPWKRYRGYQVGGHTASTHRTSLLRNPSVFVNNENYIMNWYSQISHSDIYSQINSFIYPWKVFDIHLTYILPENLKPADIQSILTYILKQSDMQGSHIRHIPSLCHSCDLTVPLGNPTPVNPIDTRFRDWPLIPRHTIYSESS